MIDVGSYAQFLRTKKIDEINRQQIELFTQENIGLIRQLLQNGEQKTHEYLKERLNLFLLAFERGTAKEYFDQRLELFRNDALPDITTAMVSLEDVLLMSSLQKQILCSYIPHFTPSSTDALQIESSFNEVYYFLQKKTMQLFRELQNEQTIELKESGERYRDLFDNAHDLIHIVAPEGTIHYVNSYWKKSLEYEEEEIKGKSIYSFVDEADRERFIEYRKNVLSGAIKDHEVRLTFITKSGKKVIVEGFVSPFFKNGVPQYTRGIFRDITSRVKSEERLKFYNEQLLEREENLSHLIRFAPDAIIVIDAASKIVLWNPKAEQIFGWAEYEVKGKNLSDIIVPTQYRQPHKEGMKRYLATGEAHVLNRTIDITALNKKGQEFYISLTISGYKTEGKQMFISFLRDISEQRRNQIELEQKKKELEESNKELEQYGWLTSHDLREPLRKILTYSDMILSRNKDLQPDVLANIRKIHQAGHRMGSLIQSILFYTTVTGEKEMHVETNLNVILDEVLNDLELSIRENNVTIRRQMLPTIKAVPFQMRQLFQNLLSNSIKYKKPEEPPVISIESSEKNNEVELVFTDNGIGFEAKDNDKAFQLFQRLHTDTKTEGTGIGLAICKKICVGHGGNIRAESEPGRGARFIINLPVHHDE